VNKHQRQARIIEMIERTGYVSIGAAASALTVTTQTIRRDFDELIEVGAINRHRGGATPNLAGKVANYTTRRTYLGQVKAAIARKLASLIPPRASLFIENGTTLEAIGPLLKRDRVGRVVTNNLHLALFLSSRGFAVALPAGEVREADGGIVGEQALRSLEDYRFDLALVGASAVEPDGSLMEYETGAMMVTRTAVARARSAILAVDATKFRHSAPLRIGSIALVSALVTDAAPPASISAAMKQAGVALHLAGT
jgi:DeoR family glycerol-3-phosphate regulon repressor